MMGATVGARSVDGRPLPAAVLERIREEVQAVLPVHIIVDVVDAVRVTS